MRVAGGFLFTAGWCVYLGGALVMELVWRPVQAQLPPSQTGVLCLRMGRTYRWLACAALGGTALGLTILLTTSSPLERLANGVVPIGSARGSALDWQEISLMVGLAVLAALVVAMGTLVHPLSHRRWSASAGGEEQAVARRKRLALIKVMGKMLRIELVVALVMALFAVVPHA